MYLLICLEIMYMMMIIKDNKNNKEHLNWYINEFVISAEVENPLRMSYIAWCVISV